jgi:hypothetical protein
MTPVSLLMMIKVKQCMVNEIFIISMVAPEKKFENHCLRQIIIENLLSVRGDVSKGNGPPCECWK